jgi:tetratricopeptide (TPR) repeat protein
MFKARIRQWEFNKNIRAEDWAALAILHKTRKDSGKRSTEFLVHGKKKTVADLLRYIKSRNMTEDQFLAAASNTPVPAHVQSYSPDPEEPESSPTRSLSDDSSTISPKKTASLLNLSPSSSRSNLSPSHDTLSQGRYSQGQGDISTPSTRITEYSYPGDTRQLEDCAEESNEYVIVPQDTRLESGEIEIQCDQVQQDLGKMASQLIRPMSLMTTYGAEDISSFQLVGGESAPDSASQLANLCLKCGRPSSAHFISLERLAPPATARRNILNDSDENSMTLPSTTREYDAACRWAALCFSACIWMTRGQSEFSTKSLTEAATVFEDMLTRRDDLVFTALHLMVTILHMHDQSEIAESVVGSAAAVAQRLLKPEDPIRLTLEWEAAAAGLGLNESGLGSKMLRQVYTDFEKERTLSHPWTIAALYNLAWMLLYEGSYAGEGVDPQPIYTEAADMLQKVYVASCASLGSVHMQSITALTTLARAQSNLGEDDKAIETYKKAIHDCRYTLGRSHPFRLEAMRRLALMYEKKEQKEKMEPLYWDVLRGRITMLGRHHPWTEGMKDDLIALLKDLEKWEDNGPLQWQIDELFEHTSETSSQHEAF